MDAKLVSVSAVLIPSLLLAAIRAVSPTPAEGQPDVRRMNRHVKTLAAVTNGGAKVVFIGDSITHFWETTGKGQLDRYFGAGDFKMLNLGTGGDRTDHVLWRITKGGELDGYEARFVNVLIGANQIEDEPLIDTLLGVREVIREVRARQPHAKVLLNAILPQGTEPSDPRRPQIAAVNRELMRLADGKDVFWLDYSDRILMPDGRLPRDVFPDGLHPDRYGYEVWASEVMPFVTAALDGTRMPPNRFSSRLDAGSFAVTGARSLRPCSRFQDEGYGDRTWWIDRLLEKSNQIAASGGEIDLVFAGDSITHNWERTAPDFVRELERTYSVLNLGHSGDSVQHLAWRLANGELDGYRAKCVMLLIGTNNADPAEDCAEGIRRILGLIAERQPGAVTLLLPIFPRGASEADERRQLNERVNAIIRGYADGRRVIWADLRSLFLDERGDTLRFMGDRLHPNHEGYRRWLEAVRPHFSRICGK